MAARVAFDDSAAVTIRPGDGGYGYQIAALVCLVVFADNLLRRIEGPGENMLWVSSGRWELIVVSGTLSVLMQLLFWSEARITEDLVSKESYGDFELKFDGRISPRGNTGVKYRIQRIIFMDNSKVDRKAGFEASLEREVSSHLSDRAKMAPDTTGQEYTVSYEFKLIDDAGGKCGQARWRSPRHRRALFYDSAADQNPASSARVEYRTAGGELDHFEHWINGVMVLDGSLHSEQAHAGAARRWANAPTIREALIHAKLVGPLSLQHHGAAVWFKNLKIRPL
jgi:hypothetical protein